tara:strand:- start:405 stop:821 length:417 start_codon:yes stop_codon:yes gene_type:complete
MATTPVGTKLYYDAADAADPANEIGNVVSITPGGDTVAIYEVAALDATTSSKIAGRTTPGQMTFECYFYVSGDSKKDYDDLNGLVGATHSFKVLFANTEASTLIGNGIVAGIDIGSIADDVVRFSVTVERSAAWTFTE